VAPGGSGYVRCWISAQEKISSLPKRQKEAAGAFAAFLFCRSDSNAQTVFALMLACKPSEFLTPQNTNGRQLKAAFCACCKFVFSTAAEAELGLVMAELSLACHSVPADWPLGYCLSLGPALCFPEHTECWMERWRPWLKCPQAAMVSFRQLYLNPLCLNPVYWSPWTCWSKEWPPWCRYLQAYKVPPLYWWLPIDCLFGCPMFHPSRCPDFLPWPACPA
jgi:hypothetical protein